VLRLNSWLVSPYSAKVRSYLAWKGVQFEDVAPSVRVLAGTIRRTVGKAIMPTVVLDDGTWLQDSSEIIDTLEASLPGVSITPTGDRQRLVNLLLELHGDEWLPMAALHYRWNKPENSAFAMREFGRDGFPWMPGPIARLMVKPVAKRMQSYLPILGIDEATHAGLESYTQQLLRHLDAHFAAHPYVFGTRPALADFALYGPLWAHLYRDVATTKLFADTPHLRGWVERMLAPTGEPGAFLEDDAIPETLEPVLATLLEEQGAYVQRVVDAINVWCDEHPDATRIPRSLGPTEFTVGGAVGARRLLTEQLWMVQRPLDVATPESLEWIRGIGPLDWEPRHRVVRRNYRVVLER
jgi:glutathione S-transferase